MPGRPQHVIDADDPPRPARPAAKAARPGVFRYTPEDVRTAQAIITGLRDDPLLFTREYLGHSHWSVPQHILRALARPHARVGVKACHSSSKTFTAADAVLWHVCTGGIAVTTAPTWTQVKKLLWTEIHKSHADALLPLGGAMMQTEFVLRPGVFGLGLSTNEGVRFQGFHGRILVVLDEAPGVRPDIWEAIEGIRAGGDVRVLALGNPTIAAGPFHAAFTSDRKYWSLFTIDAFDTPNFYEPRLGRYLAVDDLRDIPMDHWLLDENPWPFLITRRYVKEKLDTWGEQSPLWAARVRGRFPTQTSDSLFWLQWLEEARYREPAPYVESGGLVFAGVDPAGPGDDETAAVVRQGDTILAAGAWTDADARGRVVRFLAPYRDRLVAVRVDEVGIGYHFMTHLEDQGFPTVGVNVGTESQDPETFQNLKAEIYWQLRDRLREGRLAGLEDEETVEQLAGLKYGITPKGRTEIESKEAIRRAGRPSPDRAEAIVLAFADLPIGLEGYLAHATTRGWGG